MTSLISDFIHEFKSASRTKGPKCEDDFEDEFVSQIIPNKK